MKRGIPPEFDAAQLEQSVTWTDPRGDVHVIAQLPMEEIRLNFSYLMCPEVAVRLRTMHMMQELYDIRELPEDMEMAEGMKIAEAVSERLYAEMEEWDIGNPETYAQMWMLTKPMVQAFILRMAGEVQDDFLKGIEVPDALPEDFH